MDREHSKEDIYSSFFVRTLFNRMASTYGVTNYISSFGFSEIWRKQCVNAIDWNTQRGSTTTYDFMSGMGECWGLIMNKSDTTIIGVDISEEMVKKSIEKFENHSTRPQVIVTDILQNEILPESADGIISAFGLKTFNDEQLKKLAQEVFRILKKNGQFSVIEISVPDNRILKLLFMFYLKHIIPIVGKYFANDDFSYKYLGIYTENFGNAQKFYKYLNKFNMKLTYSTHFFGCATGVYGRKC